MIGALMVAVAAVAVPQAEIGARAEAAASRLVELRRDVHRNPELGNREYRTGKLIAARLRSLGAEVRYPVAKTGVVGVVRGASAGAAVLVRADIDALPIHEANDVPYRSRRGGVMHACGHDVHAAIVVGVAEVLAELADRLPGTVAFLFQPAEEGAPIGEDGGAALVLREGVLDDLPIRAVLGLHVDPTIDVGEVGWARGAVFASRDSLTVEVKGRAAHGADPGRGVDAIAAAAEIVTRLRQLDMFGPLRATLTIGTIEGGDHPALVAGSARMRGVLRVLDEDARLTLKRRMAEVVAEGAEAHGAQAAVSFVDAGVPVLRNDAALVSALLPTLQEVVGERHLREVEPQMGAEDFALYAQRWPACYLRLGVRNEAKRIVAPLHTDHFDVDEDAIPVGVRVLASLVWEALGARP